MIKKILIRILFRLLKLPLLNKPIDNARMKEWLGHQYPLQQFQDYIFYRNQHILQILGEGVMKDEEYWTQVGQRMELAHLLTEAKKSFEDSERAIKEKQKKNENTQNKKT